jgi:anti-sigma factor (TIGR02949 family)
MNCREIRAAIPAWLDHELPEREAQTLLAHLEACEACRAHARREEAFLRSLRAQLPREAAPPELKARLLALASGGGRSPARSRWGWVLSASGGLALAAGALLLFFSRPSDAGDWTRFYLAQHQAAPAQVDFATASPPQLAAWLQGKLGHPVHVPGMKDARLLGGRVCTLRGQGLGLAVYESQGRTMSLFMGDPKLLCPSGLKQPEGQLYSQESRPLALVAWEHHGHFHVAVSELALPQLRELARQCQASL